MKAWYVVIGFSILVVNPSLSQDIKQELHASGIQSNEQSSRIMFYNVENLFFPADDTLKSDEDFTPTGQYYWTFSRYRKKLNNIARVIIAIGEWHVPVLIGLCEIEEQRVLQDLIYKTPLKTAQLNFIHTNSPDKRGIDVALLYDQDKFEPMHYEAIEVSGAQVPDLITRDILYVKGVLLNTDTLHVFVNHWPSRRGGKIESQQRRILAASILKTKTDSINNSEIMPNIVIMGDFNDEPDDTSILNILQAKGSPGSEVSLINLMYPLKQRGEGTYSHIQNFKVWEMIDQIIVSQNIFDACFNLDDSKNHVEIFRPDWLLDPESFRPLRTYTGLKYSGGYSDHLPVFMDIQAFKSKK
ncbi:endonuclease [Bacteroidota bacterium]